MFAWTHATHGTQPRVTRTSKEVRQCSTRKAAPALAAHARCDPSIIMNEACQRGGQSASQSQTPDAAASRGGRQGVHTPPPKKNLEIRGLPGSPHVTHIIDWSSVVDSSLEIISRSGYTSFPPIFTLQARVYSSCTSKIAEPDLQT